jgi:CubicO group peptidase (beta-lactamase class C family)
MKRALTTLIVAAAALFAGCDFGSDEPDAEAEPPARAACDPKVERGLRAWAQAGFSGSIAISVEGKLECVAAYGTAERDSGRANTPGTVFSIGSITKAFTAAAILELAQDGKLSLSDRAGELLPQLRGPVADATVKQLLLHTSGLKGTHGEDHEALSRDQAIASIGGLEQAFAPGSRFLYSNAGYTLLALIVEQVSGTSYRGYIESRILRLPDGKLAGGFWDGQPAAPGPRATGYLEDGSAGRAGDFAGPYWAVEGNGGLAMTMPELAAWTRALFTGKIIAPEAVQTLTTPGVKTGSERSETPGWVAFDKSAFGRPVFASAGGGGDIGHNAIVAWLPESETVIAIASNTPQISAEQLLQRIGPALAAGKPLPAPRRPDAGLDPAQLKRYAGTYALPGDQGSFDVGLRGHKLAIRAHGIEATRALFPLPNGFSPADIASHEDLVRALLAGETEEGEKERDALEKTLGSIDATRIDGSLVDDGELRTYVTVTSGGTSLRLWYALNEEGGVKAAQGPADLPTLPMVGAGEDSFRPDDPTGATPDLTVTFGDGRMTITGPGGAIAARRKQP